MSDKNRNKNFTSHGGNFTSAMQTGVDPRTGQFFMNLPLFTSQTNALLGPELHLNLYSSSLSSFDFFGLGLGMSLQGVSIIDEKSKKIILSNGETWPLNGSGEIDHRHLKDCILVSESPKKKKLCWKNGQVEYLEKIHSGLYITSKVQGSLGHFVYFEWQWNGQHIKLRSVKDDTHTILCRVSYTSDAQHPDLLSGTHTTFTLWPERVQGYKIGIVFQNDYPSQIIRKSLLKSDEEEELLEMRWKLEYSMVEGRHMLSKLIYPTGMWDKVNYGSLLFFPKGGPANHFPAVSTYTRHYGGGEHSIDTVRHYSYTAENFLGNKYEDYSSGKFWSSNEDFLYDQLNAHYTYGSTETIEFSSHEEGGGKRQKIEIERRYNNYHLLLSEVHRQEDCTLTKETEYHAEDGQVILNQPAYYQFPKSQKVRYEKKGAKREELSSMTFDDCGNPLEIVHPDGSKELFEWYAAAGEEGCPKEPHGFIRFIKRKVHTPFHTSFQDEKEEITHYTYKTLGEPSCIVQESQSHSLSGELLEKQIHEYQEKKGIDFGRLISTTHSLYEEGSAGKKSVSTIQRFTVDIDGERLTENKTHTLHGGLTVSETKVKSVYSGLLLKEIDTQGIGHEYHYDSLGRILRQSHNVGTPYEETMSWEYRVEEHGPLTLKKDTQGREQRTSFDGAGRLIKEEVLDIDISQRWHTVSERSYDPLSRLIKEVHFDWSTKDRSGKSEKASNQTQTDYRYDPWGNLQVKIYSDGTEDWIETDPIALTKTTYKKAKSGKVSGKQCTEVVGYEEHKNMAHVKTSFLKNDGSIESCTETEKDGRGLVRKTTDELKNVTTWEYDALKRVKLHILADGSVVQYQYASHLSSNQAIQISAGESLKSLKTIGTRSFDGLGRIETLKCGGRTTTYNYDKNNSSNKPDKVILASKGVLYYEYIKELGDVVGRMRGEIDKKQVILKEYDYQDRKNKAHRLVSATEGGVKIHRDYSPSGRLKEETFTNGSSTHHTQREFSLGGIPELYEDIEGDKTRYIRDPWGRMIKLEDPSLSTELSYDEFGRVSKRQVASIQEGQNLSTEIHYDDFNREIYREMKTDDGKALSLSQKWSVNGLLAQRITVKGKETLKEEAFEYDKCKRLVSYEVQGEEGPQTPFGLAISKQKYEYDFLNNLVQVETIHIDKSKDIASYHYDNPQDPSQLTSLSHTNPKKSITLAYDQEGRLIKDEAERKLSYDLLGRLIGVEGGGKSGSYQYDAQNRMVAQKEEKGTEYYLFYRGEELVNEKTTKQPRRFIKMGSTCLGISEDKELRLIGGDHHQSPILSCGKTHNHHHQWSPYGYGTSENLRLGFNGQRIDPISGSYHLGNGYRAYNPVLGRFHAPDSMSPFGAGGINPYAYCSGDPINHTDPSGHSWLSWAGIAIGVLGIGFGLFTGGASLGVASSLILALDAISVGTAIGSMVTKGGTSKVLALISLGTGIAGLSAMGIAKVGGKLMQRFAPFATNESGQIYRSANFSQLRRVSDSSSHENQVEFLYTENLASSSTSINNGNKIVINEMKTSGTEGKIFSRSNSLDPEYMQASKDAMVRRIEVERELSLNNLIT